MLAPLNCCILLIIILAFVHALSDSLWHAHIPVTNDDTSLPQDTKKVYKISRHNDV